MVRDAAPLPELNRRDQPRSVRKSAISIRFVLVPWPHYEAPPDALPKRYNSTKSHRPVESTFSGEPESVKPGARNRRDRGDDRFAWQSIDSAPSFSG